MQENRVSQWARSERPKYGLERVRAARGWGRGLFLFSLYIFLGLSFAFLLSYNFWRSERGGPGETHPYKRC